MTLGKTQKRRSPPGIIFRKQNTKYFLLALLTLCAIFFANKLKQLNEFPIHHVAVYGAKNLSPEEMQHALLPLVNNGFFAVEVDNVKEQVLRTPWVAEAAVKRIWPDQVVVSVTEHEPLAYWNENSLLSTTGEIFNPGKKHYAADLPHFMGPEGKQIAMLQFYAKMNHLLQPLHLKIACLKLTPYQSWDIELANGMKVRLGYKDVLTRANHFVKVYPKIVGERATDIDYVDLRYPNGLAVRWKTVS